jgi:hypothetical protein
MIHNSIFYSKGSSLIDALNSENPDNLRRHLVGNPDNYLSRIKFFVFRIGLFIIRDTKIKTIDSHKVIPGLTEREPEFIEKDIKFAHVETVDGLIYQIPDSNSWSNSERIISALALEQVILTYPVYKRTDMNDLQEVGCVNILNRARFDETLSACQSGILKCAASGLYSTRESTSEILNRGQNRDIIFQYFKRRLKFKIKTKFLMNQNKPSWRVGYRKLKDNHGKIEIISTINDEEFVADPFVITRNGKNYVFVEKMNAENGLGQIAALELSDFGTSLSKIVLAEKFHMSFPFIFEFESGMFMVPETSASNSIRIYECVDFPYQWKFKVEALSGLRAADPMIFYHEGLWWLLCNTDRTGVNSFCLELSIFYSRNPLAGDWLAHSKNPVIDGSTVARNAGLLEEAGRIVRLAQRQGFLEYGAGLETFEILNLTSEQYDETPIVDANVDALKQKVSGHHYDRNSEIEVFDIKPFT